jgi:hypothetical protein
MVWGWVEGSPADFKGRDRAQLVVSVFEFSFEISLNLRLNLITFKFKPLTIKLQIKSINS